MERWTCPLSAISAAVLAESGVPGGQQAVVYVVLAVHDGDGMTRELPLRERGQGMLASGRRRRKARGLHHEIKKALRPSIAGSLDSLS